jgi:hypothetical protein
VPHVRLSVRGPKKMGAALTIAFVIPTGKSRVRLGKHSKHIVFGPRTLRRTWGTRLIYSGLMRKRQLRAAKHPTSLPAGNTLITLNESYSFHVEGLWKKINQVNRLHGVLKL